MNIAFVLFGDPTPRSGGYRYDLELIRALELIGHRVSVVSQRETTAYPLRILTGFFGAWKGQLRRTQFDLILADELNHSALALPLVRLKRTLPGRPTWVAVCHHLRADEMRQRLNPLRRIVIALERRFLRNVDGWICNSRATAARVAEVAAPVTRLVHVATPGGDRLDRDLNDHLGNAPLVRPTEAETPPNGSSTAPGGRPPRTEAPGSPGEEGPTAAPDARPTETGTPPTGRGGPPAAAAALPADSGAPPTDPTEPVPPLRLAYVGAVVPNKGLLGLLDVAAEVPNATVEVAGDLRSNANYGRRCTARARRRDLAGRVVFRGVVDDVSLAELLHQADVLALVSRVEGFGIVYLEAMRAGCAVIAGSRGGASEILSRGGGVLVDPGERDELRTALERLADDRNYLGTIQERARQAANSFPSWEQSMNRAALTVTGWAPHAGGRYPQDG